MRSRSGSKSVFLVGLGWLIGAALASGTASAQVLVGMQQRLFEKYGDGSVGADAVPCCLVTPMNPVPTVDARTGGQFAGPHFSEFKNRTAMVGNLLGLGTPAALFGEGPSWYGFYDVATGGVTIRRGRYTTHHSEMFLLPGGDLRRGTNVLDRSVLDQVLRPNGGPGNFSYRATGHAPGRPTFRSPTEWTPYLSMAGRIQVAAGPNRFGGTRAILHERSTIAVVANPFDPGLGFRFRSGLRSGPGTYFTSMNVVRRATASGTFAHVTLASPMATTGRVLFEGLATAWVTILPYTTGHVFVSAPTGSIGTDFVHRTETGFNDLHLTSMGGITGQLQLVSAHLLQTRGAFNQNLAGTQMTRITFTPEPASAALLGAGALALFGLITRDAASQRARRR